jgi:hypothetical protein
MNPRTAATAAALLLAASTLVSCTAAEPEPTAPPAAADPAELCAAFADVQTVMFNALTAQREGRAQEHEFQGWIRLATRVLSRIDADEATSVGAAIAQAQGEAPPVPIGRNEEGVDPLSESWGEAAEAVRRACEAEGVEIAIEAFSGG